MQLSNPKQKRTLDEVIASLPETRRVSIASRLVNLAAAAGRQSQRDAEIVEAVCRTLGNPNQQRLAARLRQLLRN